jgi:hypothetical protein
VHLFFFLGGSGIESTKTVAAKLSIVSAPGYDECAAIGGMIGKGNRSAVRKPCPHAIDTVEHDF